MKISNSPQPSLPAQASLQLQADLRTVLREGGLALHYQPQMRDGGLHGVEALLRWEHPRLGAIEPRLLVQLAEECGLLHALTLWTLREACCQMAGWRARGVAIPRVSVNLQAGGLLDPALPEWLLALLCSQGLQPEALLREITETAMLAPDPAALATAHALHDGGIALALDDFGTGYSSLSMLHRLPVSEIKLDKSFVHDIESRVTARVLICAMLQIGADLDLAVVAEGVETEAQRRFLVEHGCSVLQGYLLSPPLAPSAVETWLRTQPPTPQVPGKRPRMLAGITQTIAG